VKRIKSTWIVGFSENSTLKVKKGDRVIRGQVLFEEKYNEERVFGLQDQLRELSKVQIEEINQKFKGRKILQNEVIFEKKGWWGRRITAPQGGVFKDVDEWLNIHIIVDGKTQRMVKSPINAQVIGVKNNEIVLEFEAMEVQGKGVGDESRKWVSNGIKYVNSPTDLNYESEGKVILLERQVNSILIKAEVVGVGGVVLLDGGVFLTEDVRINFKMPTVAVSEESFKELKELQGQQVQVLVDGNSGKLLLMI
jgi:hypothetical protein